jgi:rsbT co-antagonist protein RsbR
VPTTEPTTTARASPVADPRVAEIAERWRRAHERACPFASDRSAVPTVHEESDAIVEAALAQLDAGDAPDLSAFAQRELVQLVVARAQRMAQIGMTPSAVAAYIPALAEAMGDRFPDRFAGLLHVVIETYVRAVSERATARSQEVLAEQTPVVRLGAGVVACFLVGDPEPERVERVVERLEQEALKASARILVVDLAHLSLDDPERLRAALSADVGARMLGARCVFTGVDARVRRALTEAGVALDRLELASTVGEGLEATRKKGLWARLFDS